MKIKIIQLFCLIIILGCQKNDIDVFDGNVQIFQNLMEAGLLLIGQIGAP